MNRLMRLKDIDLEGRRVLLRLGANVPVVNGKIIDDWRLQRALPTIEHLYREADRVVIVSHIENDEGSSLKPVAEYLSSHWPTSFVESWQPESVYDHLTGDFERLVVLENLRYFEQEKSCDDGFARQLSGLADVFVNEAFPVSHRSHASIVGVPRFLPTVPGFQFDREVEELSRAFDPEHSFLFILGGAKFSTKIPLVKKFIDRADKIFVGGALAHSFFKSRGWEIGSSLIDDTSGLEGQIRDLDQTGRILLPVDVTVVEPVTGEVKIKSPADVTSGEQIVDSGPETVEMLRTLIDGSALVVWNGPLGNYLQNFSASTETVAKHLSEASSESIVGGGDTVASISKMGLSDRFGFVSTGGGAMLDFLVNETLPGIQAMVNGKQID